MARNRLMVNSQSDLIGIPEKTMKALVNRRKTVISQWF
jgi:hypothetical protein